MTVRCPGGAVRSGSVRVDTGPGQEHDRGRRVERRCLIGGQSVSRVLHDATRAALTGAACLTVGCASGTTTVTKTVTVSPAGHGPKVAHARRRTARAVPKRAFTFCDRNIRVRKATTTCGFATNLFYEYWASGEASVVRAYSPRVGHSFTASCGPLGPHGTVACTTPDRGEVRSRRARWTPIPKTPRGATPPTIT